MNILPFAKTALKNLVSAPATRQYPQQPRVYQQRTRGHIQVDMNTCILCGLCSKKCPANAITVDRAGRTWSIERFGCIQCGYCVESCPKKSLSMQQAYTDPNAKKSVDTYEKAPEPPKEPAAAKEPVAAAPKGTESNA
jgi:ech hydrogenase subunit F